MSGKVRSILLAAGILLGAASLYAEDDTGAYTGFTPYSVFGFGDLYTMGSAYTASMGGVGIASRNNRFINPMNPASVTARDSLSVMMDFSITGCSKFYSQASGSSVKRSVNNVFNIGDCIMSFPIYRSSAMMVGIMPYSSTGYNYVHAETDPVTIANVGNVDYNYYGQGGIYKIFAAAGVTFFKRLSLGVEGIYYFGNILKSRSISFADPSYLSSTYLDRVNVNTFSAKFGMQYSQPVGDRMELGFGATYNLGSKLRGSITNTGAEGTLGDIHFGNELGLGVSFTYRDKLRFEFDFLNSDWRSSGFEEDPFFSASRGDFPFKADVGSSFRAGVEYIPDRRDARYYLKTVAYRLGAFYNKEYFKVAGHNVDAKGITLGATFPIFNFNAVTVAVELGERGTLENSLVQERYIGFHFSANLYDRWFHRMQYE